MSRGTTTLTVTAGSLGEVNRDAMHSKATVKFTPTSGNKKPTEFEDVIPDNLDLELPSATWTGGWL